MSAACGFTDPIQSTGKSIVSDPVSAPCVVTNDAIGLSSQLLMRFPYNDPCDSPDTAICVPRKRERTDSLRNTLHPPLPRRPHIYLTGELTDNALKNGFVNDETVSAKHTYKDTNCLPQTKEKSNPRRWSKQEDESLRLAVEKSGERNWKAIADQVPGRNHTQCLQRWTKVLKPGLVKGHWTIEEDAKLRTLVAEGIRNWGQVASMIPGRTSKQCRERWCNHLDPKINKGSYTSEEDKLIIDMQAKLGNRWSIIAQQLKGRTEDAVKIRWKSLMRGHRFAERSNSTGATKTEDSGIKVTSVSQSTSVTLSSTTTPTNAIYASRLSVSSNNSIYVSSHTAQAMRPRGGHVSSSSAASDNAERSQNFYSSNACSPSPYSPLALHDLHYGFPPIAAFQAISECDKEEIGFAATSRCALIQQNSCSGYSATTHCSALSTGPASRMSVPLASTAVQCASVTYARSVAVEKRGVHPVNHTFERCGASPRNGTEEYERVRFISTIAGSHDEWGAKTSEDVCIVSSGQRDSTDDVFQQQRLRLILKEREKSTLIFASAPSPGQAMLTKELEANKERQKQHGMMSLGWKSAAEIMTLLNHDASHHEHATSYEGLMEKVGLSGLDPSEEVLMHSNAQVEDSAHHAMATEIKRHK